LDIIPASSLLLVCLCDAYAGCVCGGVGYNTCKLRYLSCACVTRMRGVCARVPQRWGPDPGSQGQLAGAEHHVRQRGRRRVYTSSRLPHGDVRGGACAAAARRRLAARAAVAARPRAARRGRARRLAPLPPQVSLFCAPAKISFTPPAPCNMLLYAFQCLRKSAYVSCGFARQAHVCLFLPFESGIFRVCVPTVPPV
jgi:hypothetical protein